MKLKIVESDIFQEPIHGEDVLVCPCNLVGVMGKGLALTFKKKYDWIELGCKDALKHGELNLGMNATVGEYPQVMLMATKRHWRDPSRKEDVVAGLLDLKRHMRQHPDDHVRLPAVGCGEGSLSFEWLVEQCWTLFSGMNVTLYTPWAGGKR